MTEFVIYIGLMVVAYACLIVAFVAFMRWSNRREAGRSFIVDFIPECADVAAIERDLPDMRDTYLHDDFTHDDIKARDEADEAEYRRGGI